MDGSSSIVRDYIWSIRVSIKCSTCLHEMQQLSQGLTNYQWYKDYYCPKCKVSTTRLDKNQKTNKNKTIEMKRNY
jgi:Zn finger protein HypA/HybF involved in hydrogenase expression